MLPNEDDEVLLAIAESITKFKSYLDPTQLLALIPIYQFLLCVEETVVREQTVESMRSYTACFNEEQVQTNLMTLVINNYNLLNYFKFRLIILQIKSHSQEKSPLPIL